MQLDSKEVTTQCLFVSPAEGKCLSEAKVDSTADNGVNGFRSDLPKDGLNQLSSHTNGNDCNEPSHKSACTSEEFGFLNKKYILTTPPNADIYDNSEVNAKPMDFTRSTQGHAGELFSFKPGKGKDFLKSKSVRICSLFLVLFFTTNSVLHI